MPDQTAPAYIGQYSRKDGDAASVENLLVLPSGDWVVLYFGGLQHGTWQQQPGGELLLRAWRGNDIDFVVYGRHAPEHAATLRLQFHGFEDSLAKIGLAPAGRAAGPLPLQPAFPDGTSTYQSSYTIERPVGSIVTLYLAGYDEYQHEPAEYERPKFTKQLLYTFPLASQYNDYRIVCNQEASQPPRDYLGKWVNEELILYPLKAFRSPFPIEFGEQSELNDEAPEIQALVTQQRLPLAEELAIPDYELGQDFTYYRVPGTTEPLVESAITLGEPLFKSASQGDELLDDKLAD